MKENEHFKPLNSAFPEFFLEKLEQRLETDPLTTGGLLELEQDANDEDGDCVIFFCNCNTECHDYNQTGIKHAG